MKTFSDYILEKQNFIFGGKAGLTGKEYSNVKSFNELRYGDAIYSYGVNRIEKKVIWRLDRKFRGISDNVLSMSISQSWSGDIYTIYLPEDFDKLDCSIFLIKKDKYTFFVYSTRELSQEEAIEIAVNEDKYKIAGSLYIVEKQNFIFGGKSGLTGKEYGVHKTFDELKPGDDVYFYHFYDDKLEQEGSYKFKATKPLRHGSVELAFDDPYTWLTLTKEQMGESVYAFGIGKVVDATATYKMSAEEALTNAKIIISKNEENDTSESVNFVFGGKLGLTGKEYGQGKEFAELEKGDSVYYFCFENYKQVERGEYIVKNIHIYHDVVEFKFNDPKASLVLSKKDELENYYYSWEDDNVLQIFTTVDRIPDDFAKYLDFSDEDIQ